MRSYSYLKEYVDDVDCVDTSDYDRWPLVEDPVSKDWMMIMAMTMMVTMTRMIMMMMFFVFL